MTVIDVTERPVFPLGPDPVRIVYPTGIASGAVVSQPQANAFVVPDSVPSSLVLGTHVSVATVSAVAIAGDVQLGSVFVDELEPGTMEPTGISSGLVLGAPVLQARVQANGVPGGSGIGAPRAFTSVGPTGFASIGQSGVPSVSLLMRPDGIASTEAFGDADTLATVFIIPGPFDPSNDFGDAVATKRGWIFRPPVNTYKWRLFKEYEGISLLKENGVWSEVAHPDLVRTRAAEAYLAGGRDHVVGNALKAELEGLGYSVTEEIVTTEEYL